MKKSQKPRLVITALPVAKAIQQKICLDQDDPITTSGTICTLPDRG